MDPREEKSRKNWHLINQAKLVMQRDAERAQRIAERAEQKAIMDIKNVARRRANEEKKLEDDARKAYLDRQAKLNRVGSFKFDIDNMLELEVLTSDQVFEDLDDIKNIKEKTGGEESTA